MKRARDSDVQEGPQSKKGRVMGKGSAQCSAVERLDACLGVVSEVDSVYAFSIALDELQPIVMGRESGQLLSAARHSLFTVLVRKAAEYFSQDLFLEVLAFIDGYYLRIKATRVCSDVYTYLLMVANCPTSKGIRQLLSKILHNKANQYETIFTASPDDPVLSDASTWAVLEPSVEEQTAKIIQWVDSRCSNIDIAAERKQILACFVEEKQEGAEGAEDTTDMMTERVTVDLFCPLSTTRIVLPARGTKSKHLQPFDLEHFLSASLQRNNGLPEDKCLPWKCPVSGEVLDRDSIMLSPYFVDILDKVPPSVRYVTIFKDGTWQAGDSAEKEEKQEEIRFIEVQDTPFDPKYDIKVKIEEGEEEEEKEEEEDEQEKKEAA